MENQANFNGWAIVEIMGHQRYAGKVSTETFGGTVLFRVDVPPLPEREATLGYSRQVNDVYMPQGSKVMFSEVQGYSKLFGAASIYCITPCSEEAAVAAVEQMSMREPLRILEIPSRASAALSDAYADDDN